jgi:hypothetical protein
MTGFANEYHERKTMKELDNTRHNRSAMGVGSLFRMAPTREPSIILWMADQALPTGSRAQVGDPFSVLIDRPQSASPPFFLLANLLWGAYLGGRDLSPIFQPETAKSVLGVLAVAAVMIAPTGFLISTLSIALLRLLAVVFRTPTYEAHLSGPALDRIWGRIKSSQAKDKKLTLYAAATFDHELLAGGIHTWLLRRWNSFNVATHPIVALALAHAAARIFALPQTGWWWLSTILLWVLLFCTALKCVARDDVND